MQQCCANALATCNNLACLADDRHDELPDYRQDEQLKPLADTAGERKRKGERMGFRCSVDNPVSREENSGQGMCARRTH